MKYATQFMTILLCVGLLATGTFAADVPVTDDSVAEVGAVSGKVFVVRDGERFHVSEGTKLRTGDRIITDSAGTVKLRHRDGSTMYIGTSSSLIIMAPMKLTLFQGTIKAEAIGSMRIGTQDTRDIVAPAEGAEFIVRQSSEGVEVMSLSNDVNVGRIRVTPGIYAVLGKGQYPVFRNMPDFEAAEMFADVGTGSERSRIEEIAPLGFSAPDSGFSGSPVPPATPTIGGGGGGARPSPSVP